MARPRGTARPPGTPPKPAKLRLGSAVPARLAQQVTEAERLTAQLLPPSVVRKRLCETFGVGVKTVEKILRTMRAQWAAQEAERGDADDKRTEYINGYRMFYNQAMADKAFGPARQAIRDMAILDGSHPLAGMAGSVGRAADAVGALAETDPERVRQRIQELLGRHGAAIQGGSLPPRAKTALGAAGAHEGGGDT